MTGKASTSRNCTTNAIHVNIGMRMSVMPGARRLMIVVTKLNAAASDETPRIWRPITQKSMFSPGENGPRGEGCVAEPAAVRRVAEKNRKRDEDSAEQEDPVAEGVESRERDVARADLERDEKVEERCGRAA